MRKIVYSWDLPETSAPYFECHVGDILVFVVNCRAEALVPHWMREEMWNRIFALAEGSPELRRQKTHDAEIIDFETLRARRIDARRALRG